METTTRVNRKFNKLRIWVHREYARFFIDKIKNYSKLKKINISQIQILKMQLENDNEYIDGNIKLERLREYCKYNGYMLLDIYVLKMMIENNSIPEEEWKNELKNKTTSETILFPGSLFYGSWGHGDGKSDKSWLIPGLSLNHSSSLNHLNHSSFNFFTRDICDIYHDDICFAVLPQSISLSAKIGKLFRRDKRINDEKNVSKEILITFKPNYRKLKKEILNFTCLNKTYGEGADYIFRYYTDFTETLSGFSLKQKRTQVVLLQSKDRMDLNGVIDELTKINSEIAPSELLLYLHYHFRFHYDFRVFVAGINGPDRDGNYIYYFSGYKDYIQEYEYTASGQYAGEEKLSIRTFSCKPMKTSSVLPNKFFYIGKIK